MKLSEALTNGPLSRAALVAGFVSPDQEITWVQVIDHPDIEPWVAEGQLLLSTGYNWPKDEAMASELVTRLISRRIAGVVLAVPHFLEHFPEASLRTAEELGLPLLEIPWEVPFSEITQFIHRELVDQQGRALARSEQIHRQLTEAAVSGHGLQDLAMALHEVLGRAIVLFAIDGRVLGSADRLERGLSPSPPEVFLALRAARVLSKINAATHPLRVTFKGQANKATLYGVAYAVRIRGERVGYVLVHEDDVPLTALDLRAIEHAGTVAALQISHQRELLTQEARLGYALVASLIEGHFEANPRSLERAQLLGWQAQTSYRLCSVLMDEPNPLSREGFRKREKLGQQIKFSLERRSITPLLSMSANQVHVLLPADVDPDSWWQEFLPTRMALGVSQSHFGIDGMAACGRESEELVEHLKHGQVHHYAEMLFPRVLCGDNEARKAFLKRILGGLTETKRGQHLLDTALALTQEGFHLQKSADRLGVHISTLRYRFDKLKSETGLDLEDAEGRFQLQVAVRLYLMAN